MSANVSPLQPVILYDANANPMAVQNGVAIPANTSGLLAMGTYNATQPAPASGQATILQQDQAQNLLEFPGVQVKTGAAWTSATAVNTVQYPTGTITIGAPIGCEAVVVQLDQTTTLTAGAVTFQGTYDGINWVTIPNAQILNPQTFVSLSNPYTFVASTNQPFLILLQGFQQVRLNLTTAITGTGSVTPYWTVIPVSSVVRARGLTQPLYAAETTLTITMTSLANAAARASTAVSNAASLYDDVFLFFKILGAAAGVSATGYVNIYGYGSIDGGTTYPEGITGVDATVTLTAPPNLVLLCQINLNTNGKTATYGPISFRRQYGLDYLPPLWGIVVVNETGAALSAVNGSIEYQGITSQMV
jgi:hypothetical protein